MISHVEVLAALRTRLVTLVACTTAAPEPNLSATATGYARTVGSFLADGFAEGMEVTPTGFTQTATGIVGPNVTALALPITGGRTVQAVGVGRTLAALLPAARAWENKGFSPLTTGSPYIDEDYLPGPAVQYTTGPHGWIEATPQYVVKTYGLPKTGIGALYRYADALLTLFAPGTALTCASGDVVRVRTEPAPYRSQLVQDAAGFAVVVVTVPLRIETANTL